MIKRHCTLLGNTVSSQIFTNSDMEDSGNADESCFVQIDGAASEKPSKYTQDTIIWVFQRRATAGREGRGLSQESSAGSQPGTSAGLSLADFSAAFVKQMTPASSVSSLSSTDNLSWFPVYFSGRLCLSSAIPAPGLERLVVCVFLYAPVLGDPGLPWWLRG